MAKKMNRYWLFENRPYEAGECLDDLTYTFKTIKKAQDYIDEKGDDSLYDVSYIIDSKTWKVIYKKYMGNEWEKLTNTTSYIVGDPDEKDQVKWETE